MSEMPYPIVTFMDGNDFWVVRDDIQMIDGINQVKMWLTPSDAVKKRANIQDRDLDFSEDPDGWVVKFYPLSARIILSQSPERQRWLMLTDWKGNKINYENPDLYPIIQLKMKAEADEQRIKALESRNAELEDENIGLIRKTNEFRDRYKKIMGMEPGGKYEMVPIDSRTMETPGKPAEKKPEGGK